MMDKRTLVIDKKLSAIRGGAARAMSGIGMVPSESDERLRWKFHKDNPLAMNDYIMQVAKTRGIMEPMKVDKLATDYIADMERRFG
jgi:hypothetical protein